MTVVALDLSLTSSGIARADGTCRRVRTGKLRGPERLDFIVREVMASCEGADLVVIEGQAFGAQGRAKTGIAELHGAVLLELWRAMLLTSIVPPTALKKAATGSGRAGKDEMVEAARAAGAVVSGHDEADAWWLRQMGLAALGLEHAIADGRADYAETIRRGLMAPQQ